MSTSSELNIKQQEAVQHTDGALLVLAGAGSGKTRVLIERIIHILDQGKAKPWNILAVTFTNKAAKEMKHRISQAIGAASNDLWMSTFHSFCLRVLRRHADALGFDKNFVVYDDTDQRAVIKKILKENNLSDKLYKPASIQYHINIAKNEGQTPENFPHKGDYFLKKVCELFAEYQKQLLINQAMDFGDLIVNTLTLFTTCPDILYEYQNKFHYVLVDEYQDTNKSQYVLIRLLTEKWKNICVVGDDDQSIYKFRGAEIRNILDFQKDYPHAHVIRLEQNYRSTQNILDASNKVIQGNDNRLGKKLWTQNNTGDLVKVYGGQTDRDEASYVVRMIQSLRDTYKFGEIAIFYRTNAQSRSFEDELRRHNVPYRIFGGMKFYDRAEIKDVMAYLKLLVNPADSISLKRILNVPPRGIGKTTVLRVDELAQKAGVSFWDMLQQLDQPDFHSTLSSAAVLKLQEFAELIKKLNQARQELPLDEFVTHLYSATGYWQKLTAENTIESETRQENLTEFGNVIEDYLSENADASLEKFLDQISLASDIDGMGDDADYINLMTVHLAKGLEFPVVFLVGLEEGLFPHVRSLDDPLDLEEERRLCYVGMTRAKKMLHMCFVQERRLFGNTQYQLASRFLDELPEENIDMISHVTERPAQRTVLPATRLSVFRKKPAAIIKKKAPVNERCIDLDYSQTDQPFRRGARVRHAVFGEGKILAAEGQADQMKVTVEFSRGMTKKLMLKHANLMFL